MLPRLIGLCKSLSYTSTCIIDLILYRDELCLTLQTHTRIMSVQPRYCFVSYTTTDSIGWGNENYTAHKEIIHAHT